MREYTGKRPRLELTQKDLVKAVTQWLSDKYVDLSPAAFTFVIPGRRKDVVNIVIRLDLTEDDDNDSC